MSRLVRLVLIIAMLAVSLPVSTAAAQGLPPPLESCEQGSQSSGALYFICLPPDWNNDLVIFAHGYVAPGEPLTKFVEQLVLPDGSTIPGITTSLGYAFATTSYRKNGLAVKEGIEDVRDLVSIFSNAHGRPNHVYLIGASEGGLVTTLGVEKYPQTFSGGLAMCGPIGDFRKQIDYWGDFRVVFDYFFPRLLPPSPISIPSELMTDWESTYVPQITNALVTKPHATEQLLNVTNAPIDSSDPVNTSVQTTIGILSYNVFATNEGQQELDGQPFDNTHRWYSGSDNDIKLNRKVQRFAADASALAEIAANYQTSGHLSVPLITMHTTGDPIVPYWHEPLYTIKALLAGSGLKHINIPVFRYGHCNFKSSEALFAFYLLVLTTTGQPLTNVDAALPDFNARQEFNRLLQQYSPQR